MNDSANTNPNGDRPNPWLDAEEVAPLLCTSHPRFVLRNRTESFANAT